MLPLLSTCNSTLIVNNLEFIGFCVIISCILLYVLSCILPILLFYSFFNIGFANLFITSTVVILLTEIYLMDRGQTGYRHPMIVTAGIIYSVLIIRLSYIFSLSFILAILPAFGFGVIAFILSFILSIISHLGSYPSPMNINFSWNNGFLLSLIIIFQIFSGLLLSSFYCNLFIYSYYSLVHIIREVTFGFIIRYIHSNGASFIFALSFLHISRAIIFGSFIFIPLSWLSGIIILLFIIIIAFIGYVLPYGQMSFWGATVITNLLSFIPFLIEWVNGSYFISEPTLKRFFVLHYLFSFILLIILFYHLFYLHYQSSNNPLGVINYFLSPFFPYLFSKDFFGLLIISGVYYIISFISIFRLSHPDNGLTVNGFITPLHILPEWYFLSFYAIIKAIPNKFSGFIILFYSFLLYSLFVEVTSGTYSFSLFISYLYFGISFIYLFIFYSFIVLLWIGAMLPQVLFIYYGRIFIIYYLLFTLVLLDVTLFLFLVIYSFLYVILSVKDYYYKNY